VNENGKEEKGSGYASDATEDRKPTHTGPLPESSSSIWRSVFYSFRRLIYAPESLNERGILSMGWLRFKDFCCPTLYFLL